MAEVEEAAEQADDPPRGPETEPPRRINWTAVGIGAGMAAVIAIAVYFTFSFVDEERKRTMQAWQIRLGIVANSRAASVNEWVEQNFAHMRELSENASLQLYMTELALGGGDASEVTDEAAQATYLRNLLVATAERTGFKAPAPVGEVAANVEIVGVAGIALVDADGKSMVSTPAMPPVSGRIRRAVASALDGEPALIDMYMGASNLPTMGFVLPIYGIQDDAEGAKGIGAVIGMRTVGRELFERLKQPGETAETTETYLVRSTGGTVEYLSPLADGTAPLKRSLAADTPDLAATFAMQKPGGFAIKRDYAGDQVLVASRPVAALPWVLVRKITRAEALSGTETRLTTILVVFVLIIIGVTVSIIAVWRHGSSLRATAALEKASIAAQRFENMSKFMRVVTNSQPAVIAAVTGDTTYTFANEPASREAGIPVEDMMGKTMASVMGPVKAKSLEEINTRILRNFEQAEADGIEDAVESIRESHLLTIGEDEDEQVFKTEHVPLRGDRDYPPGVLMVVDDITELTRERRMSEKRMRQLIDTLVDVVDRRDPFSVDYSSRVAEVSRAIAGEMETPEEDVKTVDIAGSLMNLGRIFIPTAVLSKTGELTPEERAQIDSSYLVSAELLEGVSFEGPVVETIKLLGENWDGSGAEGKKGDDILLTARILSAASAFVSMVSPRSYRDSMTFDDAVDSLMQQAGSRFDRKPVSALVNYLDNRGGAEAWAHYRERPS